MGGGGGGGGGEEERRAWYPLFVHVSHFLEIVFSPYISVDSDAMKSRFSKFCLNTGYIADMPLFVLTRCVRCCVIAVASNSH